VTQELDRWAHFAEHFRIGDLVPVRITRVFDYGALAEVVPAPGVEGLIHISELSERRVAHPSEVVTEQEVLDARIAKIDAPRHRLGFTLRLPGR
jgi:small subunit ribosomal protein S1